MIVNKTVFVPLGSNSTYNNNALAVYQNALPGYEIIGVTNNSYSTGWQNTDALHCRTRGVMDFDMLFVDHRNVVFGEQPMQDSIAITSKFIAYSGQALKQDSLLVYYSIDGGDYQTARMSATGNQNEYVGYIKGFNYSSTVDYYVFGADQSGHRYMQPVFGAVEPHHFVIEEGPATVDHTITFNTGWSWWSTNLNITLEQLEDAIAAAVGTTGTATIKSKSGSITYANGQWRQSGSTTMTLDIRQMYKIQTSTACQITLTGIPVEPSAYEITVNPGNNWIGFPCGESMSVTDAFSGLHPVNGDVIKSKGGSSIYQGTGWRGNVETLVPGQGYIYQSKATESKTFTYGTIGDNK